jgi:titin
MVRRSLARIGASALAAVGGLAAAGAVASTSGATLTTPGAPTALTVTLGRAVGEVKLAWTAPADTGGGIGSYSVATATVTGGVTGTWSTPRTTGSISTRSTRICEATYPAVCAYRVHAVNSAGTSAASSSAQVVWAVPSAASRLRATPTSAHDFTANDLTWAAPARTGGLTVTYDVQIKVDTGAWTDIASGLTDRLLNDDNHCTGGTSCLYRVRAKNAVGYGSNSNSAALAVRPTLVTGLAASVSAVDPSLTNPTSGSSTVALSWDIPSRGLADGSYQFAGCVNVCSASSGTWTSIVSVSNASRSASVPCAAEYRTCTYRVRATNTLGGVGSWAYRSVSPFAPQVVSAAPGTTEDTITVNFQGSAETGTGAASEKRFQFHTCSSACDDEAHWTVDPDTDVPLTSIASFPANVTLPCPAGTACQVRVQFVDGDDHASPLSSVAGAVGAQLPGAPTNLVASTGAVADHMSITWTAPSVVGTPAFTTYEWQISFDGTTWSGWTATNSTATSASIDCTGGGFTCYAQVRAVNAVGGGDPSDPDSAMTATAPGQIAGLEAVVAASPGSRDLTWETADFYTGFPAFSDVEYRVKVGSGSYGSWTSTGTTSGSYTDTSCGTGNVCTYQVRAVNEVGPGLASNEATATEVPGAPTGVTVETGSVEAHVSVTWTAPANLGTPALTRYDVQISYDGTTWGSWTSTGSTSTSASVYCSSGGVDCHVRVRAVNTAGNGDPSDPDVAVSATAPGQLVLSSATASSTAGSIDLEWETTNFYTGSPAHTDVEFRVKINNGSWGTWTSTGTTSGSYTDSSCGSGNSCTYQVRAVNAVGPGLASNAADATAD